MALGKTLTAVTLISVSPHLLSPFPSLCVVYFVFLGFFHNDRWLCFALYFVFRALSLLGAKGKEAVMDETEGTEGGHHGEKHCIIK